MIFPSACSTTSPNLASSSSARPIAAKTLPASEISLVTTSTPAALVKAFTIGNSDRRAAKAVKKFAQNNPHRLKPFAQNSKAYVAHMAGDGDFYGNEKSVTMEKAQKVTIALNGKELATIDALEKEILDGTFMSVAKLKTFIAKSIEDAKKNGVLWSIHLKATMMKISDPIMFGHAFTVFFSRGI
jgi:isocitrate dehydrogenase